MDELAKVMRSAGEESSGHCPSSEIDWDAIAYAVRSYLLSEERAEAAAKMMWLSETVGGSWEDLGEWEKDSYRTSARAAITAAIGEGK